MYKRQGDTLVLVVGQDFDKRNNLARNFVVVGRRQVQKFTDARKGWLATAAFVAVIGLSAVGLVDFLKALLVLLALFLLLGYAKPADLRRQMPYQIIAIIASSLVISEVMVGTGTGERLAGWLLPGAQDFSPYWALALVLLTPVLAIDNGLIAVAGWLGRSLPGLILVGSGDREKPLLRYAATAGVKNYFFAVRDTPANTSWLSEESSGGGACGVDLLCLGSLTPVLSSATPGNSDLAAGKGWYLGLAATEQVVTAAITVSNRVTFSTSQPPAPVAGSCGSGLGTANVYNVNYLNAAPLTGEERFEHLTGDGPTPSPVAGSVPLDDGTTVPDLLGGRTNAPHDPATEWRHLLIEPRLHSRAPVPRPYQALDVVGNLGMRHTRAQARENSANSSVTGPGHHVGNPDCTSRQIESITITRGGQDTNDAIGVSAHRRRLAKN